MQFRAGKRTNRCAFTLIEMLVAVSVLGLLIAILLPAVQAAREAARKISCSNNLRNLALAALNFESSRRHLPGPTMNGHPATTQYSNDMGLFVNLLPYMEQQNLYNAFDKHAPSNSVNNRSLIATTPSLLKCPSSKDSERLLDISAKFSGIATTGLASQACDYMGNDGALVNNTAHFGTIRLRVDGYVRERRLAEVIDGTSNTFLFWESIGDALYYSSSLKASINQNAPTTFAYLIDSNNTHTLHSITQASYKSYIFAWSGFRIGSLIPSGNKVINVSNQLGEPMGAHFGTATFSFTDGSVRQLSEDVDVQVATALATAQNGEIVSEN